MRGYFASHFFNDATFRWTEHLACRIEEETGLSLYVPQRNASINDKKENDLTITDIAIAKADTEELRKANILIASIDGLSIDDGVAGEIMAHGLIKEMEEEMGIDFPRIIFGVYTDMRAEGTGDNRLYRNQMIVGKIKEHGEVIIGYPGNDDYVDELIQKIKEFIHAH